MNEPILEDVRFTHWGSDFVREHDIMQVETPMPVDDIKLAPESEWSTTPLLNIGDLTMEEPIAIAHLWDLLYDAQEQLVHLTKAFPDDSQLKKLGQLLEDTTALAEVLYDSEEYDDV